MSLKGNVKSNYRLHGKLSKLETVHGRSAYEIAVINGYEGTEPEWLESLKGESGYQIAVRYGYTGTEQEFFEDLTNFATLAEETKNAEQNAKASETNASASAVSAANDAAAAQNAKTAAENANAAAQQSEINAAKSETAAKKYADQASAAASGGVTSFNGRGGNVMPQSGDYTAAQVGAVPTARKVNGKALSSDISLTASDVGARPSTWMPTAADVGAAPAGFGVGEEKLPIVNKATLDETYKAGWYCFYDLTSTIAGARLGYVYCSGRNTDIGYFCVQDIYTPDIGALDFVHIRRFLSDPNSGWIVEYENPPMALGVEYRTTERYMGKPVYAKLVDFGALPNSSRKSEEHGIAGIDHVCGVYAEAKYPNDTSLSMIGWSDIVNCTATLSSITVETAADRSGYNGYFTLKYTKKAD